MAKPHVFTPIVEWTGNLGQGTRSYTEYSRNHVIRVAGQPDLPGSADPAFRGDKSRHNPEDLFVASLSACHMLWYFHLCADAGLVVVEYIDRPSGTLLIETGSPGRFTGVTLAPAVVLAAGSDIEKANRLHHEAHEKCFISNSVNFPVQLNPTCTCRP